MAFSINTIHMTMPNFSDSFVEHVTTSSDNMEYSIDPLKQWKWLSSEHFEYGQIVLSLIINLLFTF